MTLTEICKHFVKRRSTIQVSLRTLRNGGISQLNLTEFEQASIKNAINAELEWLMRTQRKSKLSVERPL